MPTNITATLNTALRELQAERQRRERQIAAVRSALGGVGAHARSTTVSHARRRRTMSASKRAEVGRRMKAYWAKRRAEKAAAAKKATRTTPASASATSKALAKKSAAKTRAAKKASAREAAGKAEKAA